MASELFDNFRMNSDLPNFERDLFDTVDDMVAFSEDYLPDVFECNTKDGKRYNASNIKVFKGFKEELSSGNYLYNIVHLVPAIVKLPLKLMQKISGKIMLRRESKQNIETLKERISK